MKINTERMLEQMMEMIEIESPTLKEYKMARYLEALLKNMNGDVYSDNCLSQIGGEGGNVLAFFKGTVEGGPICLNAHIDTVQKEQIIKPIIDGEYVVSDGDTILGADDKAGIAAIIEAYRSVKEEGLPHRDCYMFFTASEENGMHGVKLFDYSKLPCKEVISVDAAGAPGVIAVGGRGKNSITAKFIGKKAHAVLNPQDGINAIKIAACAVTKIPIGKLDQDSVANIGIISGGKLTHFVPDEAVVVSEVRSFDIDKLNEYTNRIVSLCQEAASEYNGDVEITVNNSYPPLKFDKQCRLYKKMCEYYNELGVKVEDIVLSGAGDCNLMTHKGYECAIIGCGMTEVHTQNERVSIKDLTITAQLIVKFLTEKY